MQVVYAKIVRFPSIDANVLQSLNMALAFNSLSSHTTYYPGVSQKGKGGKTVLLQALEGIGATSIPPAWEPIPTASKGLYGLRFRLAVSQAWLSSPRALFYARDINEAYFLSQLQRFLPTRLAIFEAHETLHLMHKGLGKPEAVWKKTMRKEAAILKSVSGLVATSEVVAEDMRQAFAYHGPLLIAPSGFNPCFFYPLPLFDQTVPWPEEHEPIQLVYIGKFHQGKGVDTLLEAMTLLPARFRLRIIGGNPTHIFQALQDQVNNTPTLQERVTFMGELPQKELAAACTGAHLCVIPQQSSFFFSPLKLFESLALGLPIVTTPLHLFAPQHNLGLVHFAPDASAHGLAQGIIDLAGHPGQAKAQREQGLAQAAQYAWPARAERILKFAAGLRAGPHNT